MRTLPELSMQIKILILFLCISQLFDVHTTESTIAGCLQPLSTSHNVPPSYPYCSYFTPADPVHNFKDKSYPPIEDGKNVCFFKTIFKTNPLHRDSSSEHSTKEA